MEVQMENVTVTTFSIFFGECFEKGWNEDLIRKVAGSENEKETLWEAWSSFCKYLKGDRHKKSFPWAEQTLKTFRYLIGRLYTEPRANELKKKITQTYSSLIQHFFLCRWKAFLSMLKDTEPQECKKTRYAFYSKVEEVFKGEEYSKVMSLMKVEYAEAYRKTGRNRHLTPNDLNPDLQYQNLAEQELRVQVKEGDGLPFDGTKTEWFNSQSVNENDYSMYDKIHRAWKAILKKAYAKNVTIADETLHTVVNKLSQYNVPVELQEEFRRMMEEDMEVLESKINNL